MVVIISSGTFPFGPEVGHVQNAGRVLLVLVQRLVLNVPQVVANSAVDRVEAGIPKETVAATMLYLLTQLPVAGEVLLAVAGREEEEMLRS